MKILAGIIAALCIVLLAAGLTLSDSAADLAAEQQKTSAAEQKAAYAQGQAVGQAQATQQAMSAMTAMSALNSGIVQISLVGVIGICGLFLWSSHALTTQNNERWWAAEQDRRDKQHQINLQQQRALEIEQARMLVQLADTRRYRAQLKARQSGPDVVDAQYVVRRMNTDYDQLGSGQ